MITVFGSPPTRATRVIWMLEEMGLPYRVRHVEAFAREKAADLLQASPAGTLPAIEDGSVRMAESVAILEYLAARYGPTPLAPTVEEASYPLFQQWLHFGEGSLAGLLNVAVAAKFFAPDAEKANWGAQVATRMALRRCGALAEQLGRTPYLAGETFTAADISCAYGVHLLQALGHAAETPAPVMDWWERLRARPAYAAAQSHHVPLGRPG